MTGSLTDKVILVTGAGKGLGRRLAEHFAAGGARVAADDVTPINLDETVAHIQAQGGQVKGYVEDIAKKLTVQTLLNQVLDDFGRIDILVNCAEVEPQKTIYAMDEWDWQRTLDVDLTGAFLLTQSAGRIMKEKGGGLIVHVGPRPKGLENRAAYLAGKAGLLAFVAAVQTEYSAFGVTVAAAGTYEEVLEICQR